MTPELNRIYTGDCLEVMSQWPENFVDTIITDPPYGIGFMGKAWDTFQREYLEKDPSYKAERAGTYDQSVSGTRSFQTWCEAWAREAYRVAKPGAVMLVSGGTRTFHRMAVGLEDAGWEIRDCLMWLYGSGFPKSLNISKAIDNAKGGNHKGRYGDSRKRNNKCELCGKWFVSGSPCLCPRTNELPQTDLARQWSGWGTALKPAWEPIILAMKPCDGTFAENAERWGVAGLNVDGGRIAITELDDYGRSAANAKGTINAHNGFDGKSFKIGERDGEYASAKGRWPANLLLDEEAAGMLDGVSGDCKTGAVKPYESQSQGYNGGWGALRDYSKTEDRGGASRFFYVAKSSRAERNEGCEELPVIECQTGCGGAMPIDDQGKERDRFKKQAQNHHPTVKPLELMKYLCQLTRTPKGGIVLDPFCGSGSTLWAAEFHNRPWLGIEMNPEYVAIAQARIARERSQMKMAV